MPNRTITSLQQASSPTGTWVVAADDTAGSVTQKLTLTQIASFAPAYSLPDATTSVKGGIIVGAGLSVSSGTVSANVTSVAGKTGAVSLTKNDVGLGSVDNTSDSAKPISTATQTALDAKADLTDSRFTDAREWSAATVTQAQAEAGTSTTRLAFTPLRVFQAIAAWWAASADKTKLDGIASGATANSTDAYLLSRANHTGTQSVTTITGLGTLATQSGTFSGTSSGTNTGDQTISLTGDVTGSGTGSFAATLATTGVSAGTYTSVTVDTKGRVTAGSNPAIAQASATVLGGIKIGPGLSIDAATGIVTAAGSYTLPTASSTVLGGVKIGSGVSIDANGAISVSTNYATTGDITTLGNRVFTLETEVASLADVATSGSYLDLTNTPAPYSLPTASSTVLGGVKVGTGLSIDGNGVLIANGGGYTLPVATASVLGGVKQGSNVTIDASGVISVAAPVTSLAWSAITGKPTFATVATTGAYSDLTGTPTLATVATTGSYTDLTNTPAAYSLPIATASTLGGVKQGSNVTIDAAGVISVAAPVTSLAWTAITGKPTFATVATSGLYSDLTGTPTLATVATSGSYTDLINTPAAYSLPIATASVLGGVKQGSNVTIDAAGVISVAAPVTSLAWTAITGKPTFATVATTGAYSDLSGTPTLATVATTGSYNDLTNKPSAYSLPVATASVLGGVKQGANVTIDGTGVISVAAPVTSLDWTAITGKPTFATVATTGSYTDLINTPAAYSLPTASSTVLGGVKIGSGVSIDGNGAISVSTDYATLSGGLVPIAQLPTGTTATTVALGNHTHAQLHDRSHAITSTSDHTATAWRAFYSNGSGQVTELALGAAGTVLQSNGASAAPSFATVTPGTKTYAVFTAMDNQPPAAAFATLDTRNSVAVLDFDDTAPESAVFVGVIPNSAVLTSGLIVNIRFAATSATSGAITWNLGIEKTTALSGESYTGGTVNASVSSASGGLNTASFTISGVSSLAAGDMFRILVQRVANDSNDTAIGDAELVTVEVRSAA